MANIRTDFLTLYYFLQDGRNEEVLSRTDVISVRLGFAVTGGVYKAHVGEIRSARV